jgi:hypothetical protein
MRRAREVVGLLTAAAGLIACTSSESPRSAATPGPTAAVSPGPRATAQPDLLFTGPPRIAYVDGRTLIRPDGSRLRLAPDDRLRWRVSAIMAYDGGYLVTDDRWFEGTVGMHRLDAHGRVLSSWASTGPAVRGPGGQVAWISTVPPESGRTGPTLLHVDDRVQRLDPVGNPSGLAWADGRWTYFAWARGGRGVRGRWWSTDLDGPPRPAGQPVWPTRPSPDGRHRMRVAADPVRLVVRGEDGRIVTVVRLPGRLVWAALPEIVWEDDAHLLATIVRDDDRRVLARIDLQGRISRAGEWQPARRGTFPLLTPPA